jgi:hypothetical protein
MRTAFATLICVLLPGLLQAQSGPPPLPHNDVTLSIGAIGVQYRPANTYDRWHASVFGGINFGHYWTDHAKTDVEAVWVSPAKAQSYEPIFIGGDRAFAQTDYVFRDLRLSISQSVQFGRNAWVHPFLGVGIDVDYLRMQEDRSAQSSPVFVSTRETRSVLVPGSREHSASVRAVPFAKGGFKIYLSDRTYLAQEFKFGFAHGLDHVLWKTGVGIDF